MKDQLQDQLRPSWESVGKGIRRRNKNGLNEEGESGREKERERERERD
jgi:hypothetical protein